MESRSIEATAPGAEGPVHSAFAELVNGTFASPLLGFLVALLGLSTTLGWLLHIPLMFQLRAGLIPMVFNTGLCFLIAGTALVLPAWRSEGYIKARTVLAAALIGLCSLTLIELLLDRSILGIDLAMLHSWYDYGNTRPGRMAPNTAIGFIVAACVIFAGDRVTSRSRGMVAFGFTFLLLIIGLTGLAGYALAPELLFNWAKSARMSLQTATGMILLALSLWLSWFHSAWYANEIYFREDGKVRLLSGAILIVVTTTAALTGFVLQQETERAALIEKLSASVRARGPWLRLMAKEMQPQAERLIVSSRLSARELNLLNAGTDAQLSPKLLKAWATDFARQGWSRVAIQVNPGLTLAILGPAQSKPAFIAPLDDAAATELLWDGVLMLRFSQPLVDGPMAGKARLVMERDASALGLVLFSIQGLGETGEVAACKMDEGMLSCLPTRWQPKPYKVTPRPAGTVPLPMQLALANQRGTFEGLDYRKSNVIAAYGQLAPGLGFVVKQDAIEVFAPIRSSLATGALMTALLSLGGAILMAWQLNPLVARMRRAEVLASEAAKKMQVLAQYDALTGLPNRALFMDRIATATLRATRSNEAVAVAFIDVDGFKGINDTHGHDVGDAMLIEVGLRLSHAVRKTDTVARLGGDEFTIILEGLTHPLHDVQKVMDTISESMRRQFVLNREERVVTLSIGVAVHLGGPGTVDPTELLKRADEAMYEAKRGGKNSHRVAVLPDSGQPAS